MRSPAQALALQRLAGNAAVTGLLERSGGAHAGGAGPAGSADGARFDRPARAVGTAVPPGSAAERTLGSAASLVRVHPDTVIAENPDAVARTDGFDIHLAPGAPTPGTPAGDFLLAHEAAHVVQQARPGPTVGRERADAEADRSAESVMAGDAPLLLSASEGPHYFEARWHQATLTNAMAAAGFSEQEQQEAYFGNWARDLNQAFVPMVASVIGTQATMTLIQMLSQMKFGRPIPPEMIGMYEPRQHADNPAGQISTDLIQSDTPQVKVSGGTLSGKPDFELDPAARDREGKKIGEGGIERKMKIDGAGVPAYMADAKGYIKEQINDVMLKEGTGGRSAMGPTGPVALQAIGNMSHTVQDLFAHSNWVEIAVAKVIDEGSVKFPPADPNADTPEGRVAKRIEDSKKTKISVVENYSADVVDAAGKARPILQTGTVSGGSAGHDTFISLKAELAKVLKENNPFGPEGAGASARRWELVVGVLQAIEDAGNDGKLGTLVTDGLDQLVQSGKAAAKKALKALPTDARSKAENVSIAGYELKKTGVGGWIRGKLGDVAELGAGAVSEVATFGVEQLDTVFTDARPYIKSLVDAATKGMSLVEAAESMKKGFEWLGHIGDDIGKWFSDHVPDVIARPIINLITRGIDKLGTAIKGWLSKAWEKATPWLLDQLGGEKTDIAESNVAEKLEALRAGMTDEERQAKLNALRDKVVAAIKKVAPGPVGDEAIQKITTLPLPQAVLYLGSPDFQKLMVDLSSQDEENVQELKEQAETLGKIQQLGDLPEWARQGASHSQIAKDHADSPFFGLAFTMANTVDTKLMALIKQAFDEMADGKSAPAKGFEGTLDPEEPGITDAEKERRRAFQHYKAMGQFTVKHGEAEELTPLRWLMKSSDYLQKFLDDRAKTRARRAKKKGKPAPADQLPGVLSPLIASIAKPDPRDVILGWLAVARTGTRDIATGGDWLSIEGEDWRLYTELAPTFDEIERLAGEVTAACTPGESAEDHESHSGKHDDEESEEHRKDEAGEEKTDVFHTKQIDALNKMRGQGKHGAEIKGKWATAAEVRKRDRDVERITKPKERLLAEIDRIFNHPYESTWWKPTVIAWCNAHKDLLVRYIDARNEGKGSHQH